MLGMDCQSATEGSSAGGEGLSEMLELTARLLDGGAPSVALRCGADGASRVRIYGVGFWSIYPKDLGAHCCGSATPPSFPKKTCVLAPAGTFGPACNMSDLPLLLFLIPGVSKGMVPAFVFAHSQRRSEMLAAPLEMARALICIGVV